VRHVGLLKFGEIDERLPEPHLLQPGASVAPKFGPSAR
jgi:hypothetical protein